MGFLWTSLYVEDLEKSIAFYEAAVGLKSLRRFTAPGGVEIAFLGFGLAGETTVELLRDPAVEPGQGGASISLGFSTDSLESKLAELPGLGISVHSGPVETPTSRFATIRDPDGFGVQFFERRV